MHKSGSDKNAKAEREKQLKNEGIRHDTSNFAPQSLSEAVPKFLYFSQSPIHQSIQLTKF